MIVVIAAGPGRDSLQGPEVLEHGALPLGRGSEDGQRVVAGPLVRGRSAGFFVEVSMPMPAPRWPLSASTGIPRRGRPVQDRWHMEPRRGQVADRAGLHRARAHREPRENPSPPSPPNTFLKT